MRRLVVKQPALRPRAVRVLDGRVLATAVRAVVRETLRTEQRLFSRPADTGMRRPESNPPQPAAPASIVSAPAVPVRAPEINISQIAEQVMRQLDHRISAWRERRGRS